MKVIVFSSSPNLDGLTEACADAARQGIEAGGAEAIMVRLNDCKIEMCHACEKGWGTCLDQHRCRTEDDFGRLQDMVGAADAIVAVTPVYWGEMSESAKAFFDRLRRCEARTEG